MITVNEFPEIEKALEDARKCSELLEQIIKNKHALEGFAIEVKIFFKGEEMT